MSWRRRVPNLGAALAIGAGVFALALTTFQPPTPQTNLGDMGSVWGVAVHGLGLLMIGAPFLASLRPSLLPLARSVLLLAGALMVGSGVTMHLLFRVGLLAAALDVVPGLVGIVAAQLLGPLRRPEVERAMAAERQRTPEPPRRRAA
jgi:hypothetical protein